MSTDTTPSLSEQKAALEAQLAALMEREREEEAKAFAKATADMHTAITKAAGKPLADAVKSGDRQAITAATAELLNAARTMLEHVAPVTARRTTSGGPRQSSGSYGPHGLRGALEELLRANPTTAYTNAEASAAILNSDNRHPSPGHVADVLYARPNSFIELGTVVWADTTGAVAQDQSGPTGTARVRLNPAHIAPVQPAEDSGKTE